MNVKDFNIFNLSLQQKKLLKKKIGQGGGSTSDDDIAVFSYFKDYDTNSFKFTLLQGTPKFDEYERLLAVFIAYGEYATVWGGGEFRTFNGLRYYDYTLPRDLLDKLGNAKIGEVITFSIDGETSYPILYKIHLNSNKSFPSYVFSINEDIFLESSVKIIYTSQSANGANALEFGTIKKIDDINSFLYISIMDQIWKYSFTKTGKSYSDFTFVEVVQP